MEEGLEEALVDRLQKLLDLQWDCLQTGRASKLTWTRLEIAHTMSELVYKVYEPQAKIYQVQLKESQDKIAAVTERTKEVESLSREMVTCVDEETRELNAVVEKLDTVQVEIEQLEKQLRELKQTRDSLGVQRNALKSAIDGKVAVYKKKYDSVYISSEEAQQEIGDESQRIKTAEAHLQKVQRENAALKQGMSLWVKVCALVQSTEEEIAVFVGKMTTEPNVSKELLKLLEKSIDTLTNYMGEAKAEGWTLLSVAIFHELEAMSMAVGMVEVQDEGKETEENRTSNGEET